MVKKYNFGRFFSKKPKNQEKSSFSRYFQFFEPKNPSSKNKQKPMYMLDK